MLDGSKRFIKIPVHGIHNKKQPEKQILADR